MPTATASQKLAKRSGSMLRGPVVEWSFPPRSARTISSVTR